MSLRGGHCQRRADKRPATGDLLPPILDSLPAMRAVRTVQGQNALKREDKP